ncbi:hypothetical protein [Shewanella waksmanii]|uniref:hypothetical protein n=1 Tax=Shewanella waksmanii TaxID=213783 RepID=UPI003735A9B3
MKPSSKSPSLPLKQASKDYFEQQTLTDKQAQQFAKLLQQHDALATSTPVQASRNKLRGPHAVMAIAASILLLVMFNLSGPRSSGLAWEIANEVAVNHIKMKPLEIEAQALPPLQRYFTELDFAVTASQRVSATLLGGRYCSIQGESAAQLRYQQVDGQIVTLYEVPFEPQRHQQIPQLALGEPPMSLQVRGIAVLLWVEKGLLMAQVSDIES